MSKLSSFINTTNSNMLNQTKQTPKTNHYKLEGNTMSEIR